MKLKLSEHDGAFADFERADRLEPNNALTLAGKGLVKLLVAMHKMDEAVGEFLRLPGLNPSPGEQDVVPSTHVLGERDRAVLEKYSDTVNSSCEGGNQDPEK